MRGRLVVEIGQSRKPDAAKIHDAAMLDHLDAVLFERRHHARIGLFAEVLRVIVGNADRDNVQGFRAKPRSRRLAWPR